jgi:hypothetical protein
VSYKKLVDEKDRHLGIRHDSFGYADLSLVAMSVRVLARFLVRSKG